MPDFQILIGDALAVLRTMPEASVDCVVTSPPYWGLRDYGHAGQLGLEDSPVAFVGSLLEVFREVRRVLKPAGTLWLNLGDSYMTRPNGGPGRTSIAHAQYRSANALRSTRKMATTEGLKHKDLVGIPWRAAFALQDDGWYLRSDIIWSKPNPMPESTKDRPTKAHEYLFLLSKSERYHYDSLAISEPLAACTLKEIEEGYNGKGTKDYEAAGVQNPSSVKARIIAGKKRSGNLERKPRPGPEGDARNQSGNIPWEDASGRRNRRTVWTIPSQPFKGAHFAVMPEALVEPCILAGCPEGGLVLDPFAGSGTVGAVALKNFRRFVGIELNPAYAAMATRRIAAAVPGPALFNQSA